MNNELADIAEIVSKEQIEKVLLADGGEILCKKVKRDTLAGMETFLPGMMQSINYLVANGLAPAAQLANSMGKTPLFVAVGNVGEYVTKNANKDILLGATRGADGKINAQPGFKEAPVTMQGLEKAAKLSKAIPYVGLAIAVIEVGTKIVVHQKQIKAEQQQFYAEQMEALKEHYDMLWEALNDYPIFIKDEASRTAYTLKIINALSAAKSKYDNMKSIAESSKHVDENTIKTMQFSIIVFSMAYMLRILYSGTDCRSYIEKAMEEIRFKTEEFNNLVDMKLEQKQEREVKGKKWIERAETPLALKFKNENVQKVADVMTGGLSSLTSKGASWVNNKIDQRNEASTTAIISLKMEDNPFIEYIQNIEIMTAKDNLVLFDDDYVYYQIADKVS